MFENLTPTERSIAEIISDSGRTVNGLSLEFGVSQSTIRDHLSSISDDYNVVNSGGEYEIIGEGEDEGPTTIRETKIGSSTKAAKTRQATNELEKLEGRLMTLLDGTEPTRADGGVDPEPGSQDVVVYRTDDHFGAFEEDQNGDTIYDARIAEDRVQQHFDAAFGAVEFRQRAGVNFNTCYIALGGDLLDGEGIYSDQAWHQEMGLGEQIEYVGEVYLEQIKRASALFPNVVVACQGGNHGEVRLPGGSSPGANADGFVYTVIDLALRHSDLNNVSLLRSDATNYLNFSIRDHNIHMRHGQNGLGHIGTSAGESTWGSWLRHHDFDLALRGHHHQLKMEPIDDKMVFMGGTTAPSGDFAESLGVGKGKPRGLIFGSSSRSPTEWIEPVEFE